jgi:hypothetical protein
MAKQEEAILNDDEADVVDGPSALFYGDGDKKGNCGVCRHPLRAEIEALVADGIGSTALIMRRYHLTRAVVRYHLAKHFTTLWERCKVCADQVYGGPRCNRHNPDPDEREKREAALPEPGYRTGRIGRL